MMDGLMSMRQRRSVARIAGILLLATSVGCGDSGSPAIYDCPELVGSWASPEYEALAVHSDGSSEVLSGLSMTMEVTEQVGCNFRAETIWGNDEVGGREPVAGRIHLNGREVTLLDLPGAGATGRVVGTLVGEKFSWAYAGLSDEDRRAVVFETTLARVGSGDIEPTPACPDVSGSWNSEIYEALRQDGAGPRRILEGLSMTLEVEEQVGCTFRGVNRWSNGEIGGEEVVAGVMRGDRETFTIVELGPHPVGGTRASVTAWLNGEDMEWAYTGLAVAGDYGTVFRSKLSRTGPTRLNATCPDIRGDWRSGRYEALAVASGGAARTITGLEMVLRVDFQEGCMFSGANEWNNGEIGGVEPIVGVIYGEGRELSIVEIGEPPEGGSAGLVTGIRIGEDRMEWDYAGLAVDGSQAIVFGVELER